MKISYMSDIHHEVHGYDIPKDLECDVLVLAGDISTGCSFINNVVKWLKHNKKAHVVQVCGNHEFYGKVYQEVLQDFRKHSAAIERFHLLEKDSVEIGDVVFHGTTLWTDFDKENPTVMFEAGRYMNDYRRIVVNIDEHGQVLSSNEIGHRKRTLCADDTLNFHKKAVKWLESLVVDTSKKNVLVTHHAPSWKSIHSRYIGDPLNGAYASDLEELIQKFDLCVHGHVHSPLDYEAGKTRVICNPRGYIGYEKVDFDPYRSVEL